MDFPSNIKTDWFPTYTLNIMIAFYFIWRISFDGQVPKVYRSHLYDHFMRKKQRGIQLTTGNMDYICRYEKTETILKVILLKLSRYNNIDFGYHPNNPQISNEEIISLLADYIKYSNSRFQ
jgi:hypothetical protein